MKGDSGYLAPQQSKKSFFKIRVPEYDMKNTSKILIVGDVHGNFPKLKAQLDSFQYNPEIDKLVFVGDIMDRGSYNARVANYIQSLNKDNVYVIAGNHEIQHAQLLPMYRILAEDENIRRALTYLFKFYKEKFSWPKNENDINHYVCSKEEREKILDSPIESFDDAVRYILKYTIAWEDTSIWDIITNILDTMCGYPYDAEKTLYDYFRVSKKTRAAMESIWNSEVYEVNIPIPYKNYKKILVTHNNPFGNMRSMCPDPKQTETLFVFGHIPNEKFVQFTQNSANNGYIDIDLSPKNVGVLRIR